MVFPPSKLPAVLYEYTEKIAVENRGENPIDFGGISTEGFLNLSWQRAVLISVDRKCHTSSDGDGNPLIIAEGPKFLNPGDSYSVTLVWRIESFNRLKPSINREMAGSLEEIPSSLKNYTLNVAPWWSPSDIRLDTEGWRNTPYYNLTIREVASLLAGNRSNVLEIVFEDIKWISRYITYYSASPTYPVETARNMTGDCDDQANLLISLLRMQGIPAFLMMGIIYIQSERYSNRTVTSLGGHQYNEYHHVVGHGWAMVYIPPWGWLPCDLTMTPSYLLRRNPRLAIMNAILWHPTTLVFRNVTGIGGSRVSDYIGSLRSAETEAKENSIYYKVILDLKEVKIPEHEIILRSPAFIVYSEVICCIAAILLIGLHERRRYAPRYLQILRCPYCGGENPPDAIYCGWCGKKQEGKE